MNVVQAGPTPVVAAAAQAQARPVEEREVTLHAKPVKPAPKGEQAAKYANHDHGPKHRGSRVDIEA